VEVVVTVKQRLREQFSSIEKSSLRLHVMIIVMWEIWPLSESTQIFLRKKQNRIWKSWDGCQQVC